jgi:hypothetical protein
VILRYINGVTYQDLLYSIDYDGLARKTFCCLYRYDEKNRATELMNRVEYIENEGFTRYAMFYVKNGGLFIRNDHLQYQEQANYSLELNEILYTYNNTDTYFVLTDGKWIYLFNRDITALYLKTYVDVYTPKRFLCISIASDYEYVVNYDVSVVKLVKIIRNNN